MKKLISKIKALFQKITGVYKLKQRVSFLERKVNSVCDLLESHQRLLDSVMKDNRVIINQIKLINKDFSVVADINHSKYEPSVVIVLKRGKQEIVKTYQFENKTVEEVYRFLEGFGKENVRIDSNRKFFPGPNFRY